MQNNNRIKIIIHSRISEAVISDTTVKGKRTMIRAFRPSMFPQFMSETITVTVVQENVYDSYVSSLQNL